MKELISYKDRAFKCVRCGFCQYHCPVYTVTGFEPLVARGRLEVVKAGFDGRMTGFSEKLMKRMNQCLLCGNCTQNCPPAIETDKIVEACRAASIKENGLPEQLKSVQKNISEVGNITGDQRANRMLWLKNIEAGLEGVKVNRPAEYAYFAGCVPTLYPSAYNIPQSFVRILKAANVDYTLLGEEENCCGYPLAVGGLPEDALKVVKKNIQKLKDLGIKKIVTSCPSCYHMWKEYYPELLGKETGIEVLHSTQLLAGLASEGKLKFREMSWTVTYHDPCDIGRKSKIFDEPRDVINSIPGVTLKEMKFIREDARCCGGGGNLEMSDPNLSGLVARDRVKQALETGAGIIVTACQQCKRTLQTGVRLSRSRIKVMDICEMVAEALMGESNR